MVLAQIPSLPEISIGIQHVANGTCEMASSAVQQWVNSPSTAQAGLHLLAAQIDTLEHLVVKLRMVADGIEQVHSKLQATLHMEWHSPAGTAFRDAVAVGQSQTHHLEHTARETVRLAQASIEELRILISGLQSLIVAARTAVGDTVSGALQQVCS